MLQGFKKHATSELRHYDQNDAQTKFMNQQEQSGNPVFR